MKQQTVVYFVVVSSTKQDDDAGEDCNERSGAEARRQE